MGIKKLTVLITAFICIGLGGARASAHEFIQEISGRGGAILHISPGDDPAADEESHAYYEIKTDENLAGASANINFRSIDGSIDKTLPVTLKGSTASVGYTFPARGTYIVTLFLGLKDSKLLQLKTSLQITRGKGTAISQQPAPAWAKAGSIIAIWGVIILAFSAIRHRKALLPKSR